MASHALSTDELFDRYRHGTHESNETREASAAHEGESEIPRVRVNFVTSADGAATVDGRSGSLGGSTDRKLMRVLRSMSDAVLVGAGTVRAEGYGGLTIPASLLAQGKSMRTVPHPRIVIATNKLDLTPDMSVFTEAEVRPLIVAPRASVERAGTKFGDVADVLTTGEEVLDLASALRQLAQLGLGQVLCEGGPHLFGSLLEQDLVDEVCLTVSPTLTAGHATRIAVSDREIFRSFALQGHVADDEGFLFTRYVRRARRV